MADKPAVFLCSGCGIGDSLSMEGLSSTASSQSPDSTCRIHPALCSQEGLRLIVDGLSAGVTTIVIGACSPRVKQECFSYDGPAVVERVNLREHVAWTHEPGHPDTQAMAEDSLRMGIVRALKVSDIKPFTPEVSRTILVVGGGISGLSAALGAADAGSRVCLVEKSPSLGGWVTRLHRQYPKEPPFREPLETGIESLVKAAQAHPLIRILPSTIIEKIEGSPGMFDVTLNSAGASETIRVGAVIMATGFQPYDPDRLGHLGFGSHPDVITSVQMEQLASEGVIKRPSDGKTVQTAAFIQCAGQLDSDHLPYCSSFCCLTSLKQALYLTGNNAESKAYILYKHFRTPSLYEDFYRNAQESGSIFLSRTETPRIITAVDMLTVEAQDLLLNEKISLNVDLVVLATGMVPSPAPALNLAYRQGGELPELRYGFPDSHFICFPYETRRTGIYAAGCARQPMDSLSSREDAYGAAVKAIQCIEMVARGESVHPRAGDRSYPELYMPRCTQCKRCTEECPFGMYDEDSKFNPLPNPTRCRRCGICMGACPERIISFADYSVDITSSMIKAIEIPETDEEKPRILAFLCENDAYPALDMAGVRRMRFNPHTRIIPVRCLGSINMVCITDALSRGIDGVILVGCKHGDDYQCHNITGSELAETRIVKMKDTLDKLSLEAGRLRVVQLSLEEYGRLPAILDEFLESIVEIGPNPYKDL
ncbi:MAG: FAD-dependent oxidoreductase [Dehalococcoidia bacterium]